LLANIYLNEQDHLLGEKYRMVRYADDFVILTTCEAGAEKALAEVRKWMASHQLELHPDKTRLVNATDDPNGFDFLGYTFKKGMRLVRKKSLMAMRDKIRLHTRRSQGVGITTVIDRLNPILRGWFVSVQRYHQLPIILVLYSTVFDQTSKRQQFVDTPVSPSGQFF